MSFEVIETSRNRGRPVELFFFRYGTAPSAYYAYTNAERPITWDGITYRPVPIDRDAVKTNGTLDKSMLNIKMPKTLEVPELFRLYPPSFTVQCIIRQGHFDGAGESEFLVVWTGKILNSKRQRSEAIISGEPVQSSMRRTGLRQHYQYGCPHELYGPLCKAIKRKFPARVSEISGTTISLAPGWNTSGMKSREFNGGLVEWNSLSTLEPRTILRVLSTDVFLLSGFLRELTAGDTVDMILGCAHDLRACERVHNNVLNFGGDAWIPFDSPFGKNPF